MKKYEGMFLIDSETASKKRDEVIAHIRDTVQKHQGEVLDLDKWEDLKLAYEIKKHRKGAYFLGHFTIPPGEVNNIRDEFLISDMVLRHMFIIDTGRTQFLEDDSDYGAPKPARREPRTAQAAPKETAPKEAAPEEMISKEESPDTAKDTTLEAPEKAEEPAEEEKTEAPKEPSEE
ncbi:MAG: 30S ribosomal protein S6 [Planctomycetota bacterium]